MRHQQLQGETPFSFPALDGETRIDLGAYQRLIVTNLDVNEAGRAYFDLGLRLMLSYQHEMASKCFLASLEQSPDCALAHGLLALCHSPNYNFKGEAYYESACHFEDTNKPDLLCVFPSQQVADRHSRMAVEKIEELRKAHRKRKGKKKQRTVPSNNGEKLPSVISDVECQWLAAIRVLTSSPGVDPDLSHDIVGRPYSDAMRKVYEKFDNDPEIAYGFAESLMVLNAWQLYEYPSGKPLSPDVVETRAVLERSLKIHPHHAGLCHMYVHLSEMSAHPEKALAACQPLRGEFPHAGHLVHMATHVDVLLGDYESCVHFNCQAIRADRHVMASSPATAGKESFYFGYIVHNYHMAVYGAILGGMQGKAMELADELNELINEDMFREFPDLTSYLESYAALEVHIMVRFGRWKEILELELPKDQRLMLFRACTLRYARGLALAALGRVEEANKEMMTLDALRVDPEATMRILHNNTIFDLLAVDSVMLHGEIAYREGQYEKAFALLRQSVQMQDDLVFDEPWGKMQPIRHALGGLLLERGHLEEATAVFRKDLHFHPKNPWALVGLIECLKCQQPCCCEATDRNAEIAMLQSQLAICRSGELADFDIEVPCECCQRSPGQNTNETQILE
jgi:tetratricopeptide (TPR) repeat protein